MRSDSSTLTTPRLLAAGLVCAAMAATSRADIIYTSQIRTISATTSADAGLITSSAPDFGPFVNAVSTTTTINTPTGPRQTRGNNGINCGLDLNAIRANGTVAGQGGTDDGGNDQSGGGEVRVEVTFTLTSPSDFLLSFSTIDLGIDVLDEFELEFENDTTSTILYRVDDLNPITSAQFAGTLQPGDYHFKYHANFNNFGDQTERSYQVELLIPGPSTAALGAVGLLALGRRRRSPR